MANVSFKRGLAANLPTSAQDGVFYLTTDTNRLYVGQGEKLAELNKYIRQINTVNDLPAPSSRAIGDFVHVKTGNMLLVCKDTTSTGTAGWTQVNSQDGDHDTYVTSISKVKNSNGEAIDYVTSDATGITVQFNIDQVKHNLVTSATENLTPIPVSFKIAASDITTANKVAVGIGATAITGGGATVAVKGAGSDSSSIALKPGSNVTINADSNNNVTIAAKDTTYTFTAADNALTMTASSGGTQNIALATGNDAVSVSGTSNKVTVTHKAYTTAKASPNPTATLTHGGTFEAITGVTTDKGHLTGYTSSTFTLPAAGKDTKINKIDVAAAENGGLTVTATNNDSSTITGTLAEGLYYTINGTKYYNQGALPVYNTDQIDSKFKALNAMTYKGTVAPTGGTVSALPTEGVSVGDTYLIAATSGTYGGQFCRKGDLLIAQGTEDASTGFITGKITWTYVPSGDDIDTTYNLKTASNVVKLVPSTNTSGNSGSITVAGHDKNIEVNTSGTEGAATITITHASKTVDPKTSNQAATAGGTVTMIDSITADATGHIATVNTKTVTLPKDTNTTYAMKLTDIADNAATVTLKAGGTGGTDTYVNLKSDGNVTLVADNSKNIVTLAHKAGTTVAAVPDKDTSGNAITTNLTHTGTFTVATGVVTDSTGHVTGYNTRTFKLPSDNNTTYALSASASKNDNTVTITNTLKPNNGTTTYGTFALKSNNLSVSNSGTTVTMDLVWGSF